MVHDPDILILDEPTAGLDPIQIREVRALIRELGDRHTILLSTHIMSEVEAVCGRVIIIARGRIAVDDPLDRTRGRGARSCVEARGPAEAIRAVAGVGARGSTRVEPGRPATATSPRSRSRPATAADLREALAARLIAERLAAPAGSTCGGSTLEERFVQAVHAGEPSPRRRRARPTRGRLTMRHVPTLLRRELGAYFLGPMAFLILLAFQVIAWLNFWELVDSLSRPQRSFSEPARPAEHVHLGEHAVLDRPARRGPRPDDAADRRGAADAGRSSPC